MAKIEPPSCWQCKQGDVLAVRPLNWDEIIHEDKDKENCADPTAPNHGGKRPNDGYANHNPEGEQDTQGGEKGTRKGKRSKDGKGKGIGKAKEKGKGKRNGKGTGIVKQTPGGDNISGTVALQKQTYQAKSDRED
jgi:hypothetical protein